MLEALCPSTSTPYTPPLTYRRGKVTIRLRVPETLPQEVLALMHAPPKPDYPVIEPAQLAEFDGFLLGVPTRYGTMPAQWKVRLWAMMGTIRISVDGLFVYRRSGMRPAHSGRRAHSRASTQGCSCPRALQEVDKVRLWSSFQSRSY